MQRKPSHFGSKRSPASCGTSCTALASIGFTGGITGRSTGSTVRAGPELEPVLVDMDVDDTPAEAAVRARGAGVAGVGGQAPRRGRRRLAGVPRQDRRGRRRPARDGPGVAAHEVRGRLGGAALAGGVRRPGPHAASRRAWSPRRRRHFDVAANFFMVGIDMAGPTLMAHGTPEQQKRFLEPMLRGDESWCQLFSEPGSGSDLASLEHAGRARRRRVGARRPEGVDVVGPHRRLGHLPRPHRPRRRRSTPASPTSSSTCTRRASTCGRCARSTAPSTSTRCSSTACGCPHDHVVGDVGDGWRVAMTTLTAERTVDRRGRADRLARAHRPGPRASAATDDPVLRQELARLAHPRA